MAVIAYQVITWQFNSNQKWRSYIGIKIQMNLILAGVYIMRIQDESNNFFAI